MKASDNQIKEIKSVINSNRLVIDRIEALNKEGYTVQRVPMGSGGVGQVKEMSDGTTRIQIGYGVTRHNYAYAVIIK